MNSLKKIYYILNKKQRNQAIILLNLLIIGMFFEMLGVSLVIPLINIITQEEYFEKYPFIVNLVEILGNPSRTTLITISLTFVICVFFLKTLFLTFLSWFKAKFIYSSIANISQSLFKIYLDQPYVFHLQRNSSELIRNSWGEIHSLVNGHINTGINLLKEILVVFGISIILLLFEPVGFLSTVAVFGFLSFIFLKFTRTRITNWGLIRQKHDQLLIQRLQQGLGGAKDILLLGRSNEFLKEYNYHVKKLTNTSILVRTFQELPKNWLELIMVIGLSILMITLLIQNYKIDVMISTIALFVAAAFKLLPSINQLITSIQSVRFYKPALDLMYDELSLKDNNKIKYNLDQDHINWKNFEIEKLYFKYPKTNESTLKNINIKLKRNETIGFIGKTGSGKSTLIDIILGLLKPSNGKIIIDNKDMNDNPRSWQNQIGYVPQNIFLTDDTIRRNIAFGLSDDEIDDNKINNAINNSQLDQFINELPDGFHTIVGERGIRLSGGQCQRIGIARALYHEPEVIVLDEATSSLDVNTEKSFMETIKNLKGSKTILIVSHRLSTVTYCDKVYQIIKGEISIDESFSKNQKINIL